MLSGLLAGLEKVFAGDGRIGADGSSGDKSESLPSGRRRRYVGLERHWRWRGRWAGVCKGTEYIWRDGRGLSDGGAGNDPRPGTSWSGGYSVKGRNVEDAARIIAGARCKMHDRGRKG